MVRGIDFAIRVLFLASLEVGSKMDNVRIE